MRQNKKGFTLIELLVVISIVALIASVVLASLNTARDRGRIGAGRQFEANVYHAAADSAIGIWDFDECSGTTFRDRSGNGNNLTAGSAIWSTTEVPFGTGCSLSFNASYAPIAANLSVASFSNNEPFTISLWVKKTTVNTREIFVSSASYTLGGYALGTDGGTDITFYTQNAPSSNSQITAPAGTFVAGFWTQVTAVYDGTYGYIYKDGKLALKSAIASPGANTNAFRVGFATQGGWSNLTNANIFNLRVYGKALTASEIGNMYAVDTSRFPELARK